MMKAKHLLLALTISTLGWAQNATEIISKSEALLRGSKSYAEVSIRTVRPNWERTMGAKMWSEGTDKSMILLTAPKREKGTVFLRNGEEVWNYVPAIKKLVLLPAAMVQNWMGTDFSNDALINTGSLVEDYDHKLLGTVDLDGTKCYELELTPKPEAPVVWGRIVAYISTGDFMQRKAEFYDEDNYLITTLTASEIKSYNGRKLPSKWTMVPAEEEDQFTEMTYLNWDFNPTFSADFFTKANMKVVE